MSEIDILVLMEKQNKDERCEETSGANDDSRGIDPLFPSYDETADASQDCKNPIDTVENNDEDDNDLKSHDANETTIDTVERHREATKSNNENEFKIIPVILDSLDQLYDELNYILTNTEIRKFALYDEVPKKGPGTESNEEHTPGKSFQDLLNLIDSDAEKKGYTPTNDITQHETTIGEIERHRGVTGSTRDHQNLIDILYNEGCISLLHKQHIEQQPTRQQQNLAMLQLIKNGSIKTFKVALEYFRVTNQDHVFDMLNRKYLSEGMS